MKNITIDEGWELPGYPDLQIDNDISDDVGKLFSFPSTTEERQRTNNS